MVIDTSAVAALLFNEEEAPRLELAVERDPVRLLSAGSFLEAAIVVEARYGEPGGREFDLLLHAAQIEIASVDESQAEIARRAYRRWGRGQHRAGLNYGDCFAYALSKTSGEPLLCKGDDFTLTDANLVQY